MILQDILDQHLEEAVMLSSRRMRSVHNSLLKLSSLAQLDRRIDAHLDGLGVDGEHAWELCESVLKFDDAGEVFVVAHVALASAEAGRLQHVVEAAISSPEAVRGVVAALGWLSFTRVASVVESFASSSVPEQRCIAVAARSSHRVQGDWVQKALADEHPLVRARACRAVGELGRVELVNVLRANFRCEPRKARSAGGE